MNVNIKKAVSKIEASDDYTGSKRADKLESAIMYLMREYTEELDNMGYSKEDITALITRDWLNDLSIFA